MAGDEDDDGGGISRDRCDPPPPPPTDHAVFGGAFDSSRRLIEEGGGGTEEGAPDYGDALVKRLYGPDGGGGCLGDVRDAGWGRGAKADTNFGRDGDDDDDDDGGLGLGLGSLLGSFLAAIFAAFGRPLLALIVPFLPPGDAFDRPGLVPLSNETVTFRRRMDELEDTAAEHEAESIMMGAGRAGAGGVLTPLAAEELAPRPRRAEVRRSCGHGGGGGGGHDDDDDPYRTRRAARRDSDRGGSFSARRRSQSPDDGSSSGVRTPRETNLSMDAHIEALMRRERRQEQGAMDGSEGNLDAGGSVGSLGSVTAKEQLRTLEERSYGGGGGGGRRRRRPPRPPAAAAAATLSLGGERRRRAEGDKLQLMQAAAAPGGFRRMQEEMRRGGAFTTGSGMGHMLSESASSLVGVGDDALEMTGIVATMMDGGGGGGKFAAGPLDSSDATMETHDITVDTEHGGGLAGSREEKDRRQRRSAKGAETNIAPPAGEVTGERRKAAAREEIDGFGDGVDRGGVDGRRIDVHSH